MHKLFTKSKVVVLACLWHYFFDVHSRYGDFRLTDIPELRKIMPVTMEDFIEHVKESSKKGAEILRTQWVNECCDIIDEHRDNIEDLMPADNPVNIFINSIFNGMVM